jgi:hypothetical protein
MAKEGGELGLDEGGDGGVGNVREGEVEDFVCGGKKRREVAVEEDSVEDAFDDVFDVGAVGGDVELVFGRATGVHGGRGRESL